MSLLCRQLLHDGGEHIAGFLIVGGAVANKNLVFLHVRLPMEYGAQLQSKQWGRRIEIQRIVTPCFILGWRRLGPGPRWMR